MFCFYMTIYGINLVSLSTSLTVLKITHLLLQNIHIIVLLYNRNYRIFFKWELKETREQTEVVQRRKIKLSFSLDICNLIHKSYCNAEVLAPHRDFVNLQTGRQLSGTSLTVFKMTHLLLLFRAYFSMRLLKEKKTSDLQ